MRRSTALALLLALLFCLPATRSTAGLSVSPDGRQLLNEEGRPVFLNGATPWHILARLDRAESLRYLDARRAMGFNALLLSILVDDDFHTGSYDNAYGEPPFLVANDFSQPNEAYFEHIDWFLEEASLRGFYILLEPAYIGWGCDREGFCQAMQANGVDVMRDYGRWLGNRYGHLENLIWVNGGDADAAESGALDVVSAVAEGIRETSPAQLHSAHCNRGNSAADCYDLPWLDLNNTYADCNTTPAELREDWYRTPVRPSFYIEGWYEGEHNTSQVCLRSQAYWSLLGGSIGHFFGNNPMWDFEDGWEQALDSPGSRSMRYLRDLLMSRDWNQLVPDWDHHVLISGYSALDGRYAAAARTSDGHTVLIYTPDQRTLTVDMSAVSGDKAAAWWFNPASGTTAFLATIPTTGQHQFTPPFSGDWVLVLDDDTVALPAPGQGVGVEIRSSSGLKSLHRRRR